MYIGILKRSHCRPDRLSDVNVLFLVSSLAMCFAPPFPSLFSETFWRTKLRMAVNTIFTEIYILIVIVTFNVFFSVLMLQKM